jgi:hypothetical protein
MSLQELTPREVAAYEQGVAQGLSRAQDLFYQSCQEHDGDPTALQLAASLQLKLRKEIEGSA